MPSDSQSAIAGGVTRAGWSTTELWLACTGIGGNLSQRQIAAIVAGDLIPTAQEYDVLAATLNDHFVDRGQDHPVPYWGDLRSA